MKFRFATTNDKLKDVFLVYGKEIDKNLLLPKELEDFVFYLDGKRYIGGDFNFIEGISKILSYTFDNVWFVSSINNFLSQFDKDNLIEKCKEDEQIIITYVVPEVEKGKKKNAR